MPSTGSWEVPGASGGLAVGIAGCQREAAGDPERTDEDVHGDHLMAR